MNSFFGRLLIVALLSGTAWKILRKFETEMIAAYRDFVQAGEQLQKWHAARPFLYVSQSAYSRSLVRTMIDSYVIMLAYDRGLDREVLTELYGLLVTLPPTHDPPAKTRSGGPSFCSRKVPQGVTLQTPYKKVARRLVALRGFFDGNPSFSQFFFVVFGREFQFSPDHRFSPVVHFGDSDKLPLSREHGKEHIRIFRDHCRAGKLNVTAEQLCKRLVILQRVFLRPDWRDNEQQ